MTVGEWDQRQLCPDGACVGVIGPDGTCKVCGRAAQNWGDERKRGLIDPPDEDEDDGHALAAAEDDDEEEDDDEDSDDEDGDDEDGDGEHDDEDDDEEDDDDVDVPAAAAVEFVGGARATSGSPPEWGSRRLCSDGSCIGVIGPDGRCKACGRPAEGGTGDRGAATDDRNSIAEGNGLATAANPEAEARTACSDVSCTGSIGPDGHCGVCGKVAE